MRILVVEDEAIVGLQLSEIVTELGFESVGVCATVEVAQGLVVSKRPDLVLMDIRLAGDGDGISLAEELYTCLSVPVVFVSAHSEATTISRAVHAGAYGFVTKPFIDGAIHAAIEIALTKHEELRRHRTSASIERAAFTATTCGLVVTNLDRIVIEANPAACTLLVQPAVTLLGSQLGEVIDGLDGFASHDHLARVGTGELVGGRGHRQLDGALVFVEVRIVEDALQRQPLAIWTLTPRS